MPRRMQAKPSACNKSALFVLFSAILHWCKKGQETESCVRFHTQNHEPGLPQVTSDSDIQIHILVNELKECAYGPAHG